MVAERKSKTSKKQKGDRPDYQGQQVAVESRRSHPGRVRGPKTSDEWGASSIHEA